jgi:hypothetical protein
VGTAIAVQQKNDPAHGHPYHDERLRDVVTDEMTTASSRVARLAFQTNGAQADRNAS